MKNRPLYDTLLSVQDLAQLQPTELLEYTKLLRSISAASGGPYGIGTFNGSSLYSLNLHIFKLYARHGKRLAGAEALLRKLAPSNGSLPRLPSKSSNKTSLYALKAFNLTAAGAEVYSGSYEEVDTWLSSLNPAIRKHLSPIITSIKRVDHGGEISLLSYYFANSASKDAHSIPHDTFVQLGAANILTWVAYTLYDTISDNSGSANDLAAANTALRRAQHLYTSVRPDSIIAARLYNEVDAAFAKEEELRVLYRSASAIKRRLSVASHKKIVSSKSIAHCIGPLIVVEILNKELLPQTEKALRLYCAARQLADDIHDWLEDLAQSQPQYALSCLIQEALENELLAEDDQWNSPESIGLLTQLFWSTVLSKLLDEQYNLLQRSRKIFVKGIFNQTHSRFTEVTLDPLLTALKQAKKRNSFETEFVQLLEDS